MRLDPRRKAQLKANEQAARQRGRDYIANWFATHPCTDCGESDPVVLTFDHVRGTKRANVSDMVRDGLGLETIKAEIEKCDVLCYNCHSLRTQGRSGAYRWRMGKLGKGVMPRHYTFHDQTAHPDEWFCSTEQKWKPRSEFNLRGEANGLP